MRRGIDARRVGLTMYLVRAVIALALIGYVVFFHLRPMFDQVLEQAK